MRHLQHTHGIVIYIYTVVMFAIQFAAYAVCVLKDAICYSAHHGSGLTIMLMHLALTQILLCFSDIAVLDSFGFQSRIWLSDSSLVVSKGHIDEVIEAQYRSCKLMFSEIRQATIGAMARVC